MSRVSPDQRSRLRLLLGVVFVALLVPAVTLAWLGSRQIRFEAFYLEQSRASELTRRIDRRAVEIFSAEEDRSFVDFGYLIVGEGNYVQRSPLSAYPVSSDLPGLVSYFQVDAEGVFSTPLLPTGDRDADLESAEYEARRALQDHARALLAGSVPVEIAADLEKGSLDGGLARADALMDSDEFAVGDELARSVIREEDVPGEADVEKKQAPQPAPEPPAAPARDDREQIELAQGQRAFQRLNAPKAKTDSPLGRVSELQLKESFAEAEPSALALPGLPDASAPAAQPVASEALDDAIDQVGLTSSVASGGKLETRARRQEQNLELSRNQPSALSEVDSQPLTLFESEVDPFRFDVLDVDHFVLYRTAWRDQRRYVQGAIIAREEFLQRLVGALFRESGLAQQGSLVVAHQDEVLATFLGPRSTRYAPPAAQITGTLLYRARLNAPVTDLELIFGFSELATGPGGSLILWTTFVFLALLLGGFWLLYRLGDRQIALGEQQQDFVAAVSHELKTPLTSIRMYGEMLKAGWASEEKRHDYYEFIFSESERLTRLINNVLRLARFDRNGSDLELRTATVGELVDLARSKIASQVTQAGFELEEDHQSVDAELEADADAFVQIMINLIDNALKFSANAEEKKIVFASRMVDGSRVEFSIRDYGPGVPKQQMKKIFELFYRTEREITRETVGTGIGLALVHELTTAMGGSVDVRNCDPGAEFRVRLPVRSRN
jgi:signal transduction histidine kinase